MTKPAATRPPSKPSVFTPYRIGWSVLATMALAYLGVAIFSPSLLGDLTPTGSRAERSDDTESLIMKLAADVSGLRSSMTKLQLDVATIKSDAAAQANDTKSLGAELSSLEDKVRLAQTPVASAEPTAQASSNQSNAQPAQATAIDTPSVGSDDGSVTTSVPAPATVINAPPAKSSPITTGSLNSDADQPSSKAKAAPAGVISFGPAVVKPAGKPVGIQLASDPSLDALRLSWTQLTQNHADKLQNLQARYADIGSADNPNFSLIAGPIKSKAEAKKLCKDLQAQAVSCKVGDFKGAAL